MLHVQFHIRRWVESEVDASSPAEFLHVHAPGAASIWFACCMVVVSIISS
jgi:hypothetical protein